MDSNLWAVQRHDAEVAYDASVYRDTTSRVEGVDAVMLLWVRAEAVPRPTDHPAAPAKRLDRDQQLFVIANYGSEVVGSLMAATRLRQLGATDRYTKEGPGGHLLLGPHPLLQSVHRAALHQGQNGHFQY